MSCFAVAPQTPIKTPSSPSPCSLQIVIGLSLLTASVALSILGVLGKVRVLPMNAVSYGMLMGFGTLLLLISSSLLFLVCQKKASLPNKKLPPPPQSSFKKQADQRLKMGGDFTELTPNSTLAKGFKLTPKKNYWGSLDFGAAGIDIPATILNFSEDNDV